MAEINNVLDMVGIVKDFPGVRALDGAQLQLKPGSVHALMGENGAGKSTLMKCLFGIYREDAGDIYIEGQKVNFVNPKQALDNGVSMVHQELNQVLKRSVMENIWLGRFPAKAGFVIDHKKMYKDTQDVFAGLDIQVDPRVKIGQLSVSQRQMVEIAKAVSYNAKILVLDEPTSSLTENEVEHLFRIIRLLRDRGCGIIYISHKMEEILAISNDVTIMRDGKWIVTKPASELTTDAIIQYMVGRDLTERFPPKGNTPGEVLMRVENLTGKYQPSVKDVTFELRKGEILGLAGLVGSRRTELVETIFGYRTKESGKIFLNDVEVNNNKPRKSIASHFALLTEERRATGIFPGLSVASNSTVTNMNKNAYSTLNVLNKKKMAKDTKWVISSMNVKTPSQKTFIRNLSGGNQQKVIIGKWLLTNAEVYLFDEPTRGIDVGAKYEIYQLMIDLAKKGKGVIMVSSEMPELIGIADRIAVMSNGHLAGIEDAKTTTQEEILRLSAKFI